MPYPSSVDSGTSNASVSSDGTAIPSSSTLIGASDGTNLQQLLVESASNRNLRVALYNAANELGIDAGGRLTAILQAVGGTALAADVSNSELRTSIYGKNAAAGDTPLLVDASGRPLVNVAQINSTTIDTNSGTKSAGTQRVVLATDQPQLTNALLVALQATTSGGSTPFHALSAASNNATSVKASAGQLYGVTISNTNAAARFFKLYNKASAPAPATDNALIVLTIQIPANGTVTLAFPEGMVFSTGIAFAAVVNISDTDNTAIGANDLSMDLRYK